ncbi:MAG: FHA domain-containing protein [Kofleriaceae bacterium]|nr:FHA domain-containing protein [Kofleriaceae bacterium]
MDATAHYRNLVTLGRAEFLAAAAPAALVRIRAPEEREEEPAVSTHTIQRVDLDLATPRGAHAQGPEELELYPLAKKAGASFPDRITIGRTSNNDIVIADHSVSRLHAYMKQDGRHWVVADAGSKNGSSLEGEALLARKERPLGSKTRLRLGDVDLTFYLTTDLFAVLGGIG